MLTVSGINFAQKANLKSTLNNQQPQIKMHSQPMQDCVSFCGLPRNFGKVIEGKLYRSAKPDDFQALKDQGIKYIIDLRNVFERQSEPEEVLAASFDIKYIPGEIPDPNDGIATYLPQARELATKVKTLMDNNDGAVIVHCSEGKRRTSAFIAVCQRLLENKPTDAIVKNAEAHGGEAALVRSILRFLPQKPE